MKPDIVHVRQINHDNQAPTIELNSPEYTKLKAAFEKTSFGFWVYLMTDLILFGALFAAYGVLHSNTNGGPAGHDIFNLPFVLLETLLLLTSSFSCGIGMLAVHRRSRQPVLILFLVTLILGLSFLGLEFTEFNKLIAEGNSWRRSGFLSAFFTIVGTHGLHISIAILWTIVLMVKTFKSGVTEQLVKRYTLLSLFWHMLDIVWIFIFTIVYLLGAN